MELSLPGTFAPLVQILLLELNRKAYRQRSLLDCIATSHIVSWNKDVIPVYKLLKSVGQHVMPSPRHACDALPRGQVKLEQESNKQLYEAFQLASRGAS